MLVPSAPASLRQRSMTPLPKVQLAVCMVARLVEPIGYSVLLAFIYKMLESLLPDMDKAKIGLTGGFVESLFSIAQFLCMYRWGALSDRVGRKPVILCGLAGSCISLLLFGFSPNFYWALAARALSGAMNGNASVIRAVLGELTDATNEGYVFPLWSICWDLSLMIGPVMGGLLSDPVSQYPDSFLARIKLFQKFPYAPPCIAAASLSFFAFFLVLFFLEETLDSKKPRKKVPSEYGSFDGVATGSTTPTVTADETETSLLLPPPKQVVHPGEPVPLGARELFSIPRVRSNLASGFLIVIVALSFDAIFILYCYSALDYGGLALTPKGISACLALRGAFSVVFSLGVFPRLIRSFGIPTLYRLFVSLWIFLWILPPVMRALIGTSLDGNVGDVPGPVVWSLMGVVLVLYALGDLSFPLGMMSLNIASPSPNSLGALNGLSLTIASIGRSIGPFAAGSLYSWSASTHTPIIWVVFVIVSSLSLWVSFGVEGRTKEEEEAHRGTDEEAEVVI